MLDGDLLLCKYGGYLRQSQNEYLMRSQTGSHNAAPGSTTARVASEDRF